ncbi:MAG TPA: class I SAM-dependent methyltransferase [Nitrospira sp.]|nr:class I SAM-dependent methyltransferase [Nitrospira sp.]
MATELETLKGKLKATWMAGDYGHFATYMLPGAMDFFPTLGIKPGERVLDVGCGAGQLSLPAARAGAIVTGIDIAPNLIEQARVRAQAEGLKIRFDEGDAEALPCEDAAYDLVFSFIAAMFAPRPERVASELTRVCRLGGRMIMGNWTPQGFVGQMFKIHAQYVPPPPGIASPVLWGEESTLRERLRNGISTLRITPRKFPFRYPFPPSDVVEFFRRYYGPSNRAFAVLSVDQQEALRNDLTSLWTEYNLATDGTTHVTAEYLEVVALRG